MKSANKGSDDKARARRVEKELRAAVKRLPEMEKESEELTIEQFAQRIGLGQSAI